MRSYVAGEIEGSTDENGCPMRGLLMVMEKAHLPESQRHWKNLFADEHERVAELSKSEE